MNHTQRSPFQSAFYVANAMEIFERLAWYGMYTLLASYIMTPTSQGGLGLGNTERGLIMGVVPFFLYLFPVISGALADSFGYKKMFILSFCLMAPSYYFLGYANDLGSFISIFMLIALGAGIFKPVVIATIGRTTDASNRGLGFGVFYMMVNIGGFLGPLLAPIIQKNYGWEWVFIFAAFWISLNFIPALFFYKEPERLVKHKSLKHVFKDMQQVLGNGRLALLIVPLLILLVAFYAGFIRSGTDTVIIAALLVFTAFLWDFFVARLGKHSISFTNKNSKPWYFQKMQLGNKPFMIYLLILTGFWTVYFQLFITVPVYIRDYVDTSELVHLLHAISPSLHDILTTINVETLASEILRLSENLSLIDLSQSQASIKEIVSTLAALDVRVPQKELVDSFTLLIQHPENSQQLSYELSIIWAEKYRQMNPATILSIDFLMIILFQIAISRYIDKFKALPTLIVGTAIISLSMLLQGFAHGFLFGGLLIVSSVIIFAVGEMTASPKSQEYVASFAPQDKTAMFMGYYFVSMALGNLFGGLLSGWLYESVAISLNNPLLMWVIIALLGVLTCLALYFFNRNFVEELELQQNQQLDQQLEPHQNKMTQIEQVNE